MSYETFLQSMLENEIIFEIKAETQRIDKESIALKRRYSSRTFRYGYLVTT